MWRDGYTSCAGWRLGCGPGWWCNLHIASHVRWLTVRFSFGLQVFNVTLISSWVLSNQCNALIHSVIRRVTASGLTLGRNRKLASTHAAQPNVLQPGACLGQKSFVCFHLLFITGVCQSKDKVLVVCQGCGCSVLTLICTSFVFVVTGTLFRRRHSITSMGWNLSVSPAFVCSLYAAQVLLYSLILALSIYSFFCPSCLQNYIPPESLTLSCPVCRQTSILPEKGVCALQNNFFITNLMEVGPLIPSLL